MLFENVQHAVGIKDEWNTLVLVAPPPADADEKMRCIDKIIQQYMFELEDRRQSLVQVVTHMDIGPTKWYNRIILRSSPGKALMRYIDRLDSHWKETLGRIQQMEKVLMESQAERTLDHVREYSNHRSKGISSYEADLSATLQAADDVERDVNKLSVFQESLDDVRVIGAQARLLHVGVSLEMELFRALSGAAAEETDAIKSQTQPKTSELKEKLLLDKAQWWSITDDEIIDWQKKIVAIVERHLDAIERAYTEFKS